MNDHPAKAISDSDCSRYERDGIVCLRGIFDRDWLTFMRDWVDRAIAAPGPSGEEYGAARGGGRFFGDLDLARRHEGFRKFIHDSPAAEVAGPRWKASEGKM